MPEPAHEQPLDLSEHSPEEYEGKSLDIYGTRYIVGRLLGHGEEKLVYSLINAESKLSLHVLRIRRAPGTPWRELDVVYSLERQLAGLFFGSVRRPRGVEPVDVEARVGIGHDGEASPLRPAPGTVGRPSPERRRRRQ